MDRFDLRSEILSALRSRHGKLNDRANPVRFSCVIKKHSSPLSAWLGDGAWGCFSCGIDNQPLETLARELGINVESVRRGGFTVEDYAERKGFSLDKLATWGVRTADGKFGPVVHIPYRDANGALLRTKGRSRGKEGKSSTWWEHDGSGVFLYGLEMLAKYPNDPVILVEGESDCHAAWHHKTLAIGLPGANTWKSVRASAMAVLDGRQVYVWQEPGDAGARMVKDIAPDLPTARVLDGGAVKDLADLHLEVGTGFRAAIAGRMASSFPIDRLPPSVIFDPLIGDTLDRLLLEKLKPIDAVPTMIPTWNSHCRDAGGGVGLARTWHVTIGAKSGRGKSFIALNLAAAATKHGERVAFISLEMTQPQLATRYLSIVSGVSINELEQGRTFSTASWSAAAKVLNDRYAETGGCTFVNRQEIASLEDVIASMEYQHEVHGCRYMILDYLQLARATAKSQRESDLLAQITEISGTVRRTAKTLGVVSVALSQLTREGSKNLTSPPIPENLMGGSPIENDSDQVILLDHSTWDKFDGPDGKTVHTQLLLGKNRHGGMAEIPVKMNYRCLQMTELQVPTSMLDSDGPPIMEYPLRDDRSEAAEPDDLPPDAMEFPFS